MPANIPRGFNRSRHFIQGDDEQVDLRVVIETPGVYVVRAWLTIKRDLADTDAQAVLQKVITATNASGSGVIFDSGIASRVCFGKFVFPKTETQLLDPDESPYLYDVQVRTAANKDTTEERGVIRVSRQVTRAT